MDKVKMMKELTLKAGKKWDDRGYWTYTTCQRCDHGCQGYVGGGPVSTCDNPPKIVEVKNPSPDNSDDIMDLAREFNLTLLIERHRISVVKRGIWKHDCNTVEEVVSGTRYTPFSAGLLYVVYEAVMGEKP